MSNPQLELDRLKARVRKFISLLYANGFGKTSDTALPAEIDDLKIVVGWKPFKKEDIVI